LESKRFLKNIIIRPQQQIRLSLWGIFFCSFLFTIVLTVNMFTLINKVQLVSHILTEDRTVIEEIQRTIYQTYLYSLAMVGLLSVLFFAYMIRISHSIFGPIVPIVRFIKELQQQKYGQSYQLRKTDQLKEIMEELNKLSSELAQKEKS
jgi:signal transduction histidine kinase